jgi:hypothetical protein
MIISAVGDFRTPLFQEPVIQGPHIMIKCRTNAAVHSAGRFLANASRQACRPAQTDHSNRPQLQGESLKVSNQDVRLAQKAGPDWRNKG